GHPKMTRRLERSFQRRSGNRCASAAKRGSYDQTWRPPNLTQAQSARGARDALAGFESPHHHRDYPGTGWDAESSFKPLIILEFERKRRSRFRVVLGDLHDFERCVGTRHVHAHHHVADEIVLRAAAADDEKAVTPEFLAVGLDREAL